MAITEIEVTAEDIAKGRKGCGDQCPIALAANRAFGMQWDCMFSDDEWEWKLSRYEERYEVKGGASFAIDFDNGFTVQPRKFRIIRLEDAIEADED